MANNSCLLIVSCSRTKCLDKGKLPAIERYDGPVFRLLRRFLRENTDSNLDILIVSAKFGLIDSRDLIANYDQKMNKERSQELHPQVIEKLKNILHNKQYERLCICMGRDYLPTIEGYDKLEKKGLVVQVATGSLGKKLAVLHDWLYGNPAKFNSSLLTNNVLEGKAVLKGIEVVKTPEEVFDIARQALLAGVGKPNNYQFWYVLVGDQRISPKWLVSQLTGLPVSSFHSIAARNMLQKLGIKIYSDLSN